MDHETKAPKNEGRKAYEKPAVVHRQELLAKGQFQGVCVEADPINGKTGQGDTCTFLQS